ncbi:MULTISPECIES: SpoIID/LytB domain-containing protein [Paenibacillus]|uniref:Stage II sporulation protein D n=1 Tax=Paenibacillus pabuli TaxID=1472 RepID=A0A855XRW9_9BACL|nr:MULTISPECIES: SpoIID/LytB domain-containing protein [Paenibacillus]PWW34081.1 stage II sporulation protein D [Paenibacillus pabuli]PXW00496.1 stage II sporulation protein D [Paenibacillus taichungensis]RAJ02816.1 stage II sporulation protein D [Paenibacillus pabuli]
MGKATQTKKWSRRLKVLAAALLTVGCLQVPVYAAEGDGQMIRVAMFANLGSTYKSTTPLITLESSGKWNIGSESGASITLPAGQIRFSADGFRVKVLETGDFKTAAAASKLLQATSDKPLLFTTSLNGKSTYQLYTGNYATEALAGQAVARVQKVAAAQLGGQKPAVTGSKRLSAGVYSSLQEAEAAQASLSSAGVISYTVLQLDGGSQGYAVWVGEASSDADLSAFKKNVEASVPGVSLSPVNSNSAALIIRQDAGLSTDTLKTAPHYTIAGSEAKAFVQGDGSGIKVVERSGRMYRGDMEISIVSGDLALVNVVPLEQYLYSVVGAEVYSSWPAEALKVQAVAARSYALQQGERFKIANVVDTTLSQAYNGMGSENDKVSSAVDATSGEVIKSGGKIVEAVFSSNAGGQTAHPSEVWNGGGDVFSNVDSHGDTSAQAGLQTWYHVLLSTGVSGYIREDNVKELTAKTDAGLAKVTVTAQNTNVRPVPLIQSNVDPVAKMNPGNEAVVLAKVPQSNDFSWVRGPFTSAQLVKTLQGKTTSAVPSSISTLEVTKRGPSGRALEVTANGQPMTVKYADTYRSALGGLPSTLFDIAGTGSYTVLGADGKTASKSGSQGAAVLSASGTGTSSSNALVVMSGDGQARAVTQGQSFMFIGQGNGHGLGLSQWGAKGMADEGYDYQTILKHYYQNATIVKE